MAVTGVIFDIQRGSLRDGPGVRTTVFMKGCPLHCSWCHNPEAMRRTPQLAYFAEHCVFCGTCASVCAHGVHSVTKECHLIEFSCCVACAQCVHACLHGGLQIRGEEATVEDVMQEIERDRAFYEITGGGVTLGGGEPLHQHEFAGALLESCRTRGISTCVETSGFLPSQRFEGLLSLIDLLLFDYKLTNSEAHKLQTGVSNDLILRNLDIAYTRGVPVVLRCPIVPGINDSDEHFRGISQMDKRYPHLQGIELLPYHHLGVNKAKSIGTQQHAWCTAVVPEAERQSWIERLRRFDCTRAILR